MSGSFWKLSNGFALLLNVLAILDAHALDETPPLAETLIKLLDESDLLQELVSNNSLLLEFLRDDTVIGLLVDLLVAESLEGDELAASLARLTLQDPADASAASSDAEKALDASKNKEKESSPQESTESSDSEEKSLPGSPSGLDDETPPETLAERRVRYATLAAEILLADVWSLTDTVMELTGNLNKLWLILEFAPPLLITLATHFMKIMEHLLDMKCEEMVSYLIDNQPNLVEKFTQHLANPPMMDFLLKLISTDKPDNSTGIIDFLQEQGLIRKLVDALEGTDVSKESTTATEIPEENESAAADPAAQTLHPNETDDSQALDSESKSGLDVSEKLLPEVPSTLPDDVAGESELQPDTASKTEAGAGTTPVSGTNAAEIARQSSAADFLKALITISANSTTDNSTIGPNELTRELVLHETMSRLCDIMLRGGYALGNGVGIVIEIIRKNNSDYDVLPVLYITLESHPPTGRDPIYLGHLLQVFGLRIADFNELLMNPLGQSPLKTTFGEIEPLGFERFKICELVAELLHCLNMALLNDNKGFDIIKVRDELRCIMRKFDPVGFKYNEVIELPAEQLEPSIAAEQEITRKHDLETRRRHGGGSGSGDYNDTIDSFNTEFKDEGKDENRDEFKDDGEVHANANLSEEQMRANPVVGDFLKIALYDTQIISNILQMFFKFPWNNFLHNVVFDIVQQVLNGLMDIGFNKLLAVDVFHLGNITNRITEGQRLCAEYELANGGLRLGYMGHLTLIAEEVVKFIQLYPTGTVSALVDEKIEDSAWDDYVGRVLYDTRKKYNAILGGSDVDDDEGSNTFDESGEVMDDELDQMRLDPQQDLIGSYAETKEEDFAEDVGLIPDSKNHPKIRFTLSDDSGSDEDDDEDDDDHFASYMSLQLNASDAKDDDYIDPNDDGMSYKKARSLYDSQGMLMHQLLLGYDKNFLSESSLSSDDDDDHTSMPRSVHVDDADDDEDDAGEDEEEDDDDDEDDDEDDDDDLADHKLTRSASKG